MALCDLTRGVYLRVQDVTKVKQGTTSYIVDNSYQQCIQTIEKKDFDEIKNLTSIIKPKL